MDNNRIKEYDIKMCHCALGMEDFNKFLVNELSGNWQATTTLQDVHDAFEYKRNSKKRDIENSNLLDYQKALACQQSDRNIQKQEELAISILYKTNRLR